MMKKIFALLVATVMLLAFSNITFAANDYSMSVEYWDVDEENLIEDLSELEVGDQFYVYVYFSEIPANFTAFSTVIMMDKSVIDMVEDEDGLQCFSNNKVSNRDYWAATAKVNAVGGYTFSYAGDEVNKSGKYAFDPELPLFQFLCEVKGEGTATLTTSDTGFADVSNTEYFPTAEIAEEIIIGSGEIVPPTPSIATVVPTEAVLTDVAEAKIEKGQAVAMTFNAGDIKDYADMSWKVDFQSGTKYAPVNFPAETLADVEDNSPVQFVAAFLVYDRGYADVDVINSVSAGFSDANKNLVAQTAAVTVE